MQGFKFYIPTEIIFGPGKIKALRTCLSPDQKKIMIITDKAIHRKTNIITQIYTILYNKQVLIFDNVEENPTYHTVEAGARFAKVNEVDLILGVGGGSSMDAAKGIALRAKNPDKIKDIVENKKPVNDVLPLICIPTSSGTGSETTPFAVFSDPIAQTKNGYEHKLIFPKTSIIDPELTYSMPKHVVVNTGLDALAHCIEAYLSTESFALNNQLALEAIKIIIDNLKAATHKNQSAMNQLSYAAMIGGIVITHAGTILPHIMGYPLTIYHGVEHGKACIVLLPAFLDYLNNNKLESEKVNTLDELFKSKGGIKEFIKSFGISTNLSDYGVKESKIKTFVDKTIVKGDVDITPGNITEDAIKDIYLKSMN